MISVKVHAEGEVIDQQLPLERISDVLVMDHTLLWIDVLAPTAEDLDLLEREFGFHPLALEDATLKHERPKVDQYDSFLMIVFYALAQGPARNGSAIDMHQLSIFAGSNYVVTIHEDALPVLDETSDRWCAGHSKINTRAAGLLVYSILDALVDGYLPIIDHISDRIDLIEGAIFGNFDTATQQNIFRLKRDLLQMRKVLAPQRDVLNMLMRRDTPVYNDATARYFQDIYDHLLRVLDSIDTFRDLLSSALDSYLSVLSNRMNQVMKTLTASSIILMSMTLVASVYGMNFDHMPELHWNLGYAWALGLMVVIGGSLAAAFRRINWF